MSGSVKIAFGSLSAPKGSALVVFVSIGYSAGMGSPTGRGSGSVESGLRRSAQ